MTHFTIEKPFFKHKEQGCFGISLANLLKEMGEDRLAMRVYYNFFHIYKNSLLGEGFKVPRAIGTQVVSDLTYGRYEGILQFDEQLFRRRAHLHYPESYKEILRVLDEEKEKGRIIQRISSFEYEPPALIHVRFEDDKGKRLHSLVDCGNNLYIDGSNKRKNELEDLKNWLGIESVLTLNYKWGIKGR